MTANQTPPPLLAELNTPLSCLVTLFDREYIETVVEHALCSRDGASPGTRDSFNSIIDNALQIRGFAHPSKAKPAQLKEPVHFCMDNGDDRVAGVVLRTWGESRERLHKLIVEHLKDQGLPTEGPDFKAHKFHSLWPAEAWSRQRDAIAERHPDLQPDDVALMLCYISGGVPERPGDQALSEIKSPRFQILLRKLRELPAEASDWEDVDAFVKSLMDVTAQKTEERVTATKEKVDKAIDQAWEEFKSELNYLDSDLGSWQKQVNLNPKSLLEADNVIAELVEALRKYRPVHPQAPSRSEEARRSGERVKCEEAILATVAKWDKLMASAESSPSPSPQADENDKKPVHGEDVVPLEKYRSLREERDKFKCDYGALSSECSQLEKSLSQKSSEITALQDAKKEINEKLSQSERERQRLKELYISEQSKARAINYQPSQLTSVEDALDQAQRTFPDELHVALNAKSSISAGFQRPDEVFKALACLATEYREHRINSAKAPEAAGHFNDVIRKSCPGWTYKPKSAETTVSRYHEWYKTTVDGKVIELHKHLCKGNSFDPKSTIRIAFEWDDVKQQVIVGFVGPHQKNTLS